MKSESVHFNFDLLVLQMDLFTRRHKARKREFVKQSRRRAKKFAKKSSTRQRKHERWESIIRKDIDDCFFYHFNFRSDDRDNLIPIGKSQRNFQENKIKYN